MAEIDTPAQQLCNKLIEVFSQSKEIQEIEIFGRLAEGKSDRFSDVDIRLVSKDPLRTQSTFKNQISEHISPVIQAFTLVSTPKDFAQMLMLEDYSPYQKIDIGIVVPETPSIFADLTSVYKNDDASGEGRELMLTKIQNTVDYKLQDYLFGVPRFTKCLFRQDFDMYRRWKGMTDTFLVLLEEKYLGFEKAQTKVKLNAPQAKNLFAIVSHEDRALLRSIFPLDCEMNLARSFLNTTNAFVALSRQKAQELGVKLDDAFIDYMLEFTAEEVGRFLTQSQVSSQNDKITE